MTHISKTGIQAISNLKEALASGNWGVDVEEWLLRACAGTVATPDEVLDKLMAPEDVEDLREGRLPYESLKCFVKVWCEMRKPDQNKEIK